MTGGHEGGLQDVDYEYRGCCIVSGMLLEDASSRSSEISPCKLVMVHPRTTLSKWSSCNGWTGMLCCTRAFGAEVCCCDLGVCVPVLDGSL